VIPRVEDILVAELERRIVAALPETAPGNDQTPETFITTVEGRTVVRNVQEENTLTVFAWVTAEISVIFYSQKTRYDYSALVADFARNPTVKLNDGVFAKVEIEKSEAVEGPYLSNDAWLFTAKYPVVEVEDGQIWEAPNIARVMVGAPDIYPRSEWNKTNEPDGGGRFGR
jgi:hypothetical protein